MASALRLRPGMWFERPGRSLLTVAVAATLALVPGVFHPGLYDDFTLAKQCILVLCAAIAVVGLACEGWPCGRGLTAVVAAWCGWLMVTAALGEDWRHSVAGVYQYRQGLLTQFATVVLFVAAVALAREGVPRRLLAGAAAGGLSMAAGYAFIQALGRDPVRWWIDAHDRAIGTVGNANELAAFAVVSLAWAGTWPRARERAWLGRMWTAGVTALVTFAVLETESRSGALGLGVAIALLPLALSAVRVPRAEVVALMGTALAGAAVGVTLSVLAGGALGTAERFETPERSSNVTRSALVEGTLPAIAADPLTGAGADGLILAFPKHRPAGLEGEFETYDLPVQSAHNLLLDLAANYGLPGVALALTFLALVVGAVIRGARDRGAAHLAWWAAALAGYAVVTLFNPISLAAQATAVVLLGLAVGEAMPMREAAAPRQRFPIPARAALALPVLAIAWAWLLIAADLRANQAWGAFSREEFARAAAGYGDAAALAPFERDYAAKRVLALVAAAADAGDRASFLTARQALLEFDARFGFSSQEALALVAVDIALDAPAEVVDREVARACGLNPNGFRMEAYCAELRLAARLGGTLTFDPVRQTIRVMPALLGSSR